MVTHGEYLLMMIGCCAALPEEEKAALEKWENENLGKGGQATSDWPGWVKYIGPKPVCDPLKSRPKQIRFVYLIQNTANGYVKIGVSATPALREKTLQSEDPNLRMLAYGPGDLALERLLHDRFHSRRLRGEWFDLSIAQIAEVARLLRASTGKHG